MKSIYLLMYKAEEGVLEIRAKDFHSNYMTAVDILDDDTYLGAENSYNLFTVRKNSDAAADEDRNRLEVLSQGNMHSIASFALNWFTCPLLISLNLGIIEGCMLVLS